MKPEIYEDAGRCVDAILERVGDDVVLGAPLGIGKANHIVNGLVERAFQDSSLSLEIWTALTLSKPNPGNELEKRLMGPIVDRLFGAYPELAYLEKLKNDELPENIEVREFYCAPGSYLSSATGQQFHHSVNFTHVLREMCRAGVNVLAQLVGTQKIEGQLHYNLGGNTDLSADLIPILRERRATGGEDAVIAGQVNPNMPCMPGEAPVPEEKFDIVLDDEAYRFPLFGPPSTAVKLPDYLIGLRVSTLIEDGGTLQIGIGSLGDAIAHCMRLRHQRQDTYQQLLNAFGVVDDAKETIAGSGGTEPFEKGLYGGTEMFVEAFLHLYDDGILSRRVYGDCAIQALLNSGRITEEVTLETLEALIEYGAVEEPLEAPDVEYLVEWGILKEGVDWVGGELVYEDRRVPASIQSQKTRGALKSDLLGDSLNGGRVLHAGFFIGRKQFYERLREMSPEDRRRFSMRSVQFTNQLYRHEALNRLQRVEGRFINTGMKATVTGAVVSDGLEDNRVVSGVGGQFNFVNMAHELEDGRSIIMVRATRNEGGEVVSNIVWNYGHITIPRHLRDIIVTEYGVADLRGKSDADVVAEMINVADSRFQQQLVEKAKESGKLPSDYSIPEEYQHNYPETLQSQFASMDSDEVFPSFPFGSELSDVELSLVRSLRGLEGSYERGDWGELLKLRRVSSAFGGSDEFSEHLQRMDLAEPDSLREYLLQKVVLYALGT